MRLAGTLAFVCGLGLFGCSSSTTPAASPEEAARDAGWPVTQPVSGTRLRARVLTGGGARELVSFFDTQRNEECTFQTVTGGRLFCVPGAVTSPSSAFGDAECKNAVGAVPACLSDVKYVVTNVSDRCGQTTLADIRAVTGPATSVFFSNGQSCAPQPLSFFGASLRPVMVGNPIAWTDFVEATETMVQHGSLTERVAVSADGARQHLGYRLESLGLDCSFQVMADGTTRCVPERTSGGQVLYADASCTQPVGTFDNGSGGDTCSTRILREVAPESPVCARGFYTVGNTTPSLPEETYMGTGSSSGAQCTSSFRTSSSAVTITSITASLPAVTRVANSSARLVPALVNTATASGLTVGWHDNERNVDCAFVKATDGKVRCLPSGSSGVVFFTDSACKATSFVAAVSGGGSCGGEATRYARIQQPACTVNNGPIFASQFNTPTRVFAMSGELRNVGLSSTETSPGRCVQVAGVNGALDAIEVNPADYVEAAIVTE